MSKINAEAEATEEAMATEEDAVIVKPQYLVIDGLSTFNFDFSSSNKKLHTFRTSYTYIRKSIANTPTIFIG